MEQEELLKQLGKRVKAFRKKKGLSQQALAHLLGKDQQSIQRLEAGNVNPSYIYLLSICSGLEISLTELVDF